MMFKVPYGVSNFERIRTQGYLHVDKTHFIFAFSVHEAVKIQEMDVA